ncbi:MAG: ribonuclease HI [Firmicutes bacterium]|nr:ribonuclease HI [Bacillota bacterium]
MTLPEVVIYTDGACSGNPGPGGWAALLMYGPREKEICGYEAHTTNQRMELLAAIKGLEALRRPCSVHLHSDSAYLINAFHRKWLDKWQHNGWLTVRKRPIENQDLWKRLVELTTQHEVQWVKVEGHSDDELNNRCDYLAKQAIKEHTSNGAD